MKKILKFTFVAFLIATTIFAACKKEQNTFTPASTAQKYSSNYVPLNFSEVDLGAIHNQSVIAGYANLDFSKSTWRQDMFDNYASISYDPTPLGMTHAQFVDKLSIYNNTMASYDYDVRNAPNTAFNENIRQFVTQILNESDNINSLVEFNAKLNEIQDAAENTLYDQDLDIVKATIIVARSSAYLWAPKNLGGYGLFDEIKLKTEPYKIKCPEKDGVERSLAILEGQQAISPKWV